MNICYIKSVISLFAESIDIKDTQKRHLPNTVCDSLLTHKFTINDKRRQKVTKIQLNFSNSFLLSSSSNIQTYNPENLTNYSNRNRTLSILKMTLKYLEQMLSMVPFPQHLL